MTEFETDAEPSQGLIYEDLLPLQWRALSEKTSPLEAAQIDAKNEDVLRFIEVLDEHSGEAVMDHTSVNQELAKFEVKFDLLLSLVTQLLGVYFPLPSAIRAHLTPNSVQWNANESLTSGCWGMVEIYLNNRYPRPLVFPGRVENVEMIGQDYQITFKFNEMSESVRERLEKLIFRHHRRSIALARRRLSDGSTTHT